MRSGSPFASTTRSSGAVGKPSGGDESGVSGAIAFAGLTAGGMCRGNGGLARWEPGESTAPKRICTRWIARQLWKPFECAEMPRIACIATGRPTKRSWRRPVQSVHGVSTVIVSLKATCAISRARRSIVSAGTPVSAATFSGA